MKHLLVSFDIRSFHLNVNNRDVKVKAIFVRCFRNRNRKLCRKEASGEAFPLRNVSSPQWGQFLIDTTFIYFQGFRNVYLYQLYMEESWFKESIFRKFPHFKEFWLVYENVSCHRSTLTKKCIQKQIFLSFGPNVQSMICALRHRMDPCDAYPTIFYWKWCAFVYFSYAYVLRQKTFDCILDKGSKGGPK